MNSSHSTASERKFYLLTQDGLQNQFQLGDFSLLLLRQLWDMRCEGVVGGRKDSTIKQSCLTQEHAKGN